MSEPKVRKNACIKCLEKVHTRREHSQQYMREYRSKTRPKMPRTDYKLKSMEEIMLSINKEKMSV